MPAALRFALFLLLSLPVGCGAPTPPEDDAGGPATDAGAPPDGGLTADSGTADAGPLEDAGGADAIDAGPPGSHDAGPRADAGPVTRPADWPEHRAWDWVRSHPMFISALTARMGAPPRAAVDRYFDDFGANAAHLWASALPAEVDAWRAMRPGAPWFAWVNGDGTVAGQPIGGYAPSAPGRVGYQIGDEPRTVAEADEIVAGLAAVAQADPGALRVVNFTYGAAEENGLVERVCASGQADVFSYSLYSRSSRHYEQLAYFREMALRCGIPYWRYIKAYRATGSDESIQSESDMRWAAFVGLTYGYTGHSWFIYLVDGGDAENIPSTLFDDTERWDATPTERYGFARQLNREMAVYGRALTQLLSTNVGWVTDTPLGGLHPPAGAPAFSASMDPHLDAVELEGSRVNALLGFFVDEAGDRYVIVQNPNHSGGSFPTDDDDRIQGRLRFDFTGASGVDSTRVEVLDGRSGQVRAAALVDGALPIDLAAGDILFFKYATGRPFAGY